MDVIKSEKAALSAKEKGVLARQMSFEAETPKNSTRQSASSVAKKIARFELLSLGEVLSLSQDDLRHLTTNELISLLEKHEDMLTPAQIAALNDLVEKLISSSAALDTTSEDSAQKQRKSTSSRPSLTARIFSTTPSQKTPKSSKSLTSSDSLAISMHMVASLAAKARKAREALDDDQANNSIDLLSQEEQQRRSSTGSSTSSTSRRSVAEDSSTSNYKNKASSFFLQTTPIHHFRSDEKEERHDDDEIEAAETTFPSGREQESQNTIENENNTEDSAPPTLPESSTGDPHEILSEDDHAIVEGARQVARRVSTTPTFSFSGKFRRESAVKDAKMMLENNDSRAAVVRALLVERARLEAVPRRSSTVTALKTINQLLDEAHAKDASLSEIKPRPSFVLHEIDESVPSLFDHDDDDDDDDDDNDDQGNSSDDEAPIMLLKTSLLSSLPPEAEGSPLIAVTKSTTLLIDEVDQETTEKEEDEPPFLTPTVFTEKVEDEPPLLTPAVFTEKESGPLLAITQSTTLLIEEETTEEGTEPPTLSPIDSPDKESEFLLAVAQSRTVSLEEAKHKTSEEASNQRNALDAQVETSHDDDRRVFQQQTTQVESLLNTYYSQKLFLLLSTIALTAFAFGTLVRCIFFAYICKFLLSSQIGAFFVKDVTHSAIYASSEHSAAHFPLRITN